jgi:hypothetical protein
VLSAQTSCPPTTNPDCEAPRTEYVDAGILQFDPDAARACLAEYTDVPCDDIPFGLSRCAKVLLAAGKEGVPCGLCAPGFSCQASAPATTSLCGTCVAASPVHYPQLGEPCTSPLVDGPGCSTGLSCSQLTDGVCVALAHVGDSCLGRNCARGLWCGQQADGGAVCSPLRDLGETCDEQHPCNASATCRVGRCAALLAVGAPCSAAGDCETNHCVEGACAAQFVATGASCANRACAPADWCATDSTCRPRTRRGSPCASPLECVAGASCVGQVCTDAVLDCR